MKRAIDGCPKCEDCGCRVETPKHHYIKKDGKDYILCSTHWLKKQEEQEIKKPRRTHEQVLKDKKKKILSKVNILDTDLSTKTIEELRKIKNNLSSQKSRTKNSMKKEGFTEKLNKLKMELKGRK